MQSCIILRRFHRRIHQPVHPSVKQLSSRLYQLFVGSLTLQDSHAVTGRSRGTTICVLTAERSIATPMLLFFVQKCANCWIMHFTTVHHHRSWHIDDYWAVDFFVRQCVSTAAAILSYQWKITYGQNMKSNGNKCWFLRFAPGVLHYWNSEI